jgi:hypothetical protein
MKDKGRKERDSWAEKGEGYSDRASFFLRPRI